VADDRGVLVLRNSGGHFLIILPDAKEVDFRTAYRLIPSDQGQTHFKVQGPLRTHQSLRFSPSDWSDAQNPLPAEIIQFIERTPVSPNPDRQRSSFAMAEDRNSWVLGN
jgi:hypothetical protein